jgi:putative transposase
LDALMNRVSGRDESRQSADGALAQITDDDYQRLTGETLRQTLDIANWKQGIEALADFPRLEREVVAATRNAAEVRANIRKHVFPALRGDSAQGAKALPHAGVHKVTPELGRVDIVASDDISRRGSELIFINHVRDSRFPIGGLEGMRQQLRDDEWDRIKHLIPGKKGDPGRTGKDNRLFVEAVLWLARTGAPWRDLPSEAGNWNTIWRRFSRWAKRGVWERILQALSDDPDFEHVIIDATIVRAHQHSAGGKGGF